MNDARFFYANRCIIPYINEGLRLLTEGASPALVEMVESSQVRGRLAACTGSAASGTGICCSSMAVASQTRS